MIVSRTPFRISFAGGGTDFPEYYHNRGHGAVVSTTIDKYVYLSIHPLFGKKGYHLKYFNNESCSNLKDIRHPIIKEIFDRYNITGVDFGSSSDIPSGTGLGSSSSFTVGLIRLCREYAQVYSHPESIADEACHVEIDILNSPIGKQDQYACAYGGLNYIQFNADESVFIQKLHLSVYNMKQLQDRLILFYLGNPRNAESVLAEQKISISKNLHTLDKMVKLAENLRDELNNDNIDHFGEILDVGWQYKKELAGNVSNGAIDNWYKIAKENGATGGKVLGAGNGGFLLLYAPHGKDMLRANMRLYELPFKFELEGTQVFHI